MRCTVSSLNAGDAASTVLLATGSARACASRLLPWPTCDDPAAVDPNFKTLVAAGGGKLIDRAKYFRATVRPDLRLVAMPSIWGSGAERSRVVVLNRAGGKEIHTGDQFLPDAIAYCPEFMDSIPAWRARYACGDAWAHALEAFLSPLAGGEIRKAAAELMRKMAELPTAAHEGWFEASGEACALQAMATVGLIHGIAHTLEAPVTAAYRDASWGHSRLCSTFLFPVLLLNRELSERPTRLFREYEVDWDTLTRIFSGLFEPESYARVLPMLIRYWPLVLRDRCTRTNVALVRPSSLDFLRNFT